MIYYSLLKNKSLCTFIPYIQPLFYASNVNDKLLIHSSQPISNQIVKFDLNCTFLVCLFISYFMAGLIYRNDHLI